MNHQWGLYNHIQQQQQQGEFLPLQSNSPGILQDENYFLRHGSPPHTPVNGTLPPHLFHQWTPYPGPPATPTPSTLHPFHLNAAPAFRISTPLAPLPAQAQGTTSTTLAKKATRKRGRQSEKENPEGRAPVKRRKANVPSEPPVTVAVCGVGPSDTPPTSLQRPGLVLEPPVSSAAGSSQPTMLQTQPEAPVPARPTGPLTAAEALAKEKPKRLDKRTATDVWYFMRALDTNIRPSEPPTNEPILKLKPKSSWLGCKLCPL